MPFADVLNEQMRERGPKSLTLEGQERDEFLADAREIGQKLLQVMRQRKQFVPLTGREGLIYYNPEPTGEQEIDGETFDTFVVPLKSAAAEEVYMLEVRGLSQDTVSAPDPVSLYDNSRRLHEVMMVSPRHYETPAGTEPVIAREDKNWFEDFRAIFEAVDWNNRI